MRRQALLDCIHAAKERYPQAWARTSVDLAIQVLLHLAVPWHSLRLTYFFVRILCLVTSLTPAGTEQGKFAKDLC